MKNKNYIILLLMLLFGFETNAMMRTAKFGSVYTIKPVDHTMIRRSIFVEGSIAIAAAGTAVPMFVSCNAFISNKWDGFHVAHFRDILMNDACNALHTVCWQPDNIQAMNDLLKAQWALHFILDSSEREHENAIQLSALSCTGVPLSMASFYGTGSVEMFIAGISISYLIAGAAVVRKNSLPVKLYHDQLEYVTLDSDSIDMQFVEKNYAMVERMQRQFKPVLANYKKRAHELSVGRTQNHQENSQSVDEQLEKFSKTLKKEIENFIV